MKKKIDKEKLTEVLKDLFQEHKTKLADLNDVNGPILVYKGLIERYPELILSSDFLPLCSPGLTPELLADAICEKLKNGSSVAESERGSRHERERGLSYENKLLQRVDAFLNAPEKLAKNQQFLLGVTYGLRERGESVDRWCNDHNYSDKTKKDIGTWLADLYEVGILFRKGLYSDYYVKGKDILKLPELETYHMDVLRASIPSNGNRTTTEEQIARDASKYGDYLRNPQLKTEWLDRNFYDTKRFRFLAFLVNRIKQHLKEWQSLPTSKGSLTHINQSGTQSFSIDAYIDKRLRRYTNNISVGFLKIPKPQVKGVVVEQNIIIPK